MSDLKALLPCPNPWCEKIQVPTMARSVNRLVLFIHCGHCGFSGPRHRTKAEAIAAWNTRTPTAPAKVEGVGMTPTTHANKERIEQLRRILIKGVLDPTDLNTLCDLALRGLDAGTRGEEVDPHLLEFCRQMQKQLDANKERGDWKEGITGDWFDEGVKRNLKDMKSFTEPTGNAYRSRAAVDLANFALMFWAAFNKPSPPLKKGA